MYGYIYKTTDKTNGKIHVGKHKSSAFVGYNYLGSGFIIKTIKNKLLKENIPLENRFTIEMIDSAETLEELNRKEIYWIDKLNSRDPSIGYNIAAGSDGGNTIQGKIRITDGTIERVIEKDDILPNGFYRGCKISKENHHFYNSHYKWINDGEIEVRLNINDDLPKDFHFGRLPMKDSQKKVIV